MSGAQAQIPSFKDWVAEHPEIVFVHGGVHGAEQEMPPQQTRTGEESLIEGGHAEKCEDEDRRADHEGERKKPL